MTLCDEVLELLNEKIIVKRVKSSLSKGERLYYSFFVRSIKVANMEEFKDFVKAKPTATLRTKIKIIRILTWDEEGLRNVLNDNSIKVGWLGSRGKKDFYDSKSIRTWTSKDIQDELEDYLKR